MKKTFSKYFRTYNTITVIDYNTHTYFKEFVTIKFISSLLGKKTLQNMYCSRANKS